MNLMKLIGAVLAVCFHPAHTGRGFSSQRICRRGTEKPCYRISYHQDSRLRVGFEEARRTCRDDNGELLSIETESEQNLVERFVQELRPSDGGFWIGLHRTQVHREQGAGDCSAQYSWLDHSLASFRNWLPSEPSCGLDRCVVMSAHATITSRDMFRWRDINCNAKNNFVCKYTEEKSPVATPAGNSSVHSDIPEITQKPKQLPATLDYEKIKTGLSETSVSLSDDTISVYYILLATVPVLLLLILVVSGFFCYRVMTRKRKEQDDIYAEPGQRVCVSSDGPVQHKAHLEYMSSEVSGTFGGNRPLVTNSTDYENIPSTTAGFVTNAIYETCRSPTPMEAGWVDNDIYGY